jgi:hypothetical protein
MCGSGIKIIRAGIYSKKIRFRENVEKTHDSTKNNLLFLIIVFIITFINRYFSQNFI